MTATLMREADIVDEPRERDWAGQLELLTVGRLEPEKNPLLVVELLAELERRRPGQVPVHLDRSRGSGRRGPAQVGGARRRRPARADRLRSIRPCAARSIPRRARVRPRLAHRRAAAGGHRGARERDAGRCNRRRLGRAGSRRRRSRASSFLRTTWPRIVEAVERHRRRPGSPAAAMAPGAAWSWRTSEPSSAKPHVWRGFVSARGARRDPVEQAHAACRARVRRGKRERRPPPGNQSDRIAPPRATPAIANTMQESP